MKQESEFVHARSCIAIGKRFRQNLHVNTKEGATLLSWISLQEAEAFRQLRSLPGAMKYSRYQVSKELDKILGR
jgi:hypothetical protein